MEELMLNHQPGRGISFAIVAMFLSGPSVAQQAAPEPAVQPGIHCAGQYECVEDRPITPAEAKASHAHPQHEQAVVLPQDPQAVATERSAKNQSIR
jgi:hypothetical protein